MKKTSLLFVVAAFAATTLFAQASSPAVDRAFPSDLDDGDAPHYSRFITADLNHDGHPLIIALYTNLTRAAVRVLDDTGKVLSAPDLRGMKGFHGTVQAVDVDNDGTAEIIVQLTAGRSLNDEETWIFRWSDHALQLITPTCTAQEIAFTCLGQVTLLDWSGDGKLSILAWPAFHRDSTTNDVTPPGAWTLLSLQRGTFQQQSDSFVFARQFRRGSGSPFTSTRQFTANAGPTRLRIINGTGKTATDSGHVYLNDVEVVRPADFKRNARSFTVPVTLKRANALAVRLDGKPGAAIEVLFESSSDTQ
jgi:hypothetical protein